VELFDSKVPIIDHFIAPINSILFEGVLLIFVTVCFIFLFFIKINFD